MELKGLKVKITQVASGAKAGQHLYPAFNSLAVIISSGMDWSRYVDVYGKGWKYDKTSGHKDDSVGSPLGQQWGLLLVPAAFADQAVAAFPSECTILTDVEIGTFWEEKVTVYDNSVITEAEVLTAIKARDDLSIARTAEDVKALDPDDPTPGVINNKEKLWADYKTKHGVTIP